MKHKRSKVFLLVVEVLNTYLGNGLVHAEWGHMEMGIAVAPDKLQYGCRPMASCVRPVPNKPTKWNYTN